MNAHAGLEVQLYTLLTSVVDGRGQLTYLSLYAWERDLTAYPSETAVEV
jgi:hypothetical protein